MVGLDPVWAPSYRVPMTDIAAACLQTKEIGWTIQNLGVSALYPGIGAGYCGF